LGLAHVGGGWSLVLKGGIMAMSQDDLGAALLARHPRGELWRLLDVTVANLTFEQTAAMADGDAGRGLREQARARVLAPVHGEVAARLASRWVRWADTFGLPQLDVDGLPHEQLGHPYRPASTGRRQDYADTLLPIFDAALGVIGAPLTPDGEADYQVLTASWRRVCLPSRFTAATAYGRYTQAALSVLRFAAGMPARTLHKMIDHRNAVDEDTWQQARAEVDAASIDAGFLYRARCLYWEAVPAAEQAAGQSPTDRGLVDALWGAAVSQAFAGLLNPHTATLLCRPFRASGAVLPG
jgi:hypothetical protein